MRQAETLTISRDQFDMGMRTAEFGDTNVAMLPLDVIIDLPRQMRDKVDNDGLAALKERILPKYETEDSINGIGDTKQFNLVNPITVNSLDTQSIEGFLRDHAEYYGIKQQITVKDLPTWKGRYYIRVAGHMRGRAVRAICEERAIDPHNAYISAAIQNNTSFIEANQTQNIENTRVAVSPVDEAKAVDRYYQWQVRHGLPSDDRRIGEYFGYSAGKVHAALRFVTAPDSIKEFVDNGLSYTNVVNLVRLREVYSDFYYKRATARSERIDSQSVYTWAEQSMQDYFETIVRNRLMGKGSGQIGKAIEAKIKELQGTKFYVMDELFFMDESDQQKQYRQTVRREIGGMAVASLRYLHQPGTVRSYEGLC